MRDALMSDHMLGDYETYDGGTEPVASVFVNVKGKLALWRRLREGEPLTIVLSGEVGAPKFVRKNEVITVVHELSADVIAEAGDKLAGDVSDYLQEVAVRDKAEQDTGNRDQQSIEDAMKEDDGDEF